WLPIGSPGVFIHSGILGGRLSAFAVAAKASLPARPPRTAPPINAPPSRRKRRRDVTTGSLSRSVGSVIGIPVRKRRAYEISQRSGWQSIPPKIFKAHQEIEWMNLMGNVA